MPPAKNKARQTIRKASQRAIAFTDLAPGTSSQLEIMPNFAPVAPMMSPNGNGLVPRSALSDDTSTVEPLAYLLQPLVEAVAGAGSKAAKKTGSLTLSILLNVAELALASFEELKGRGGHWQRGTPGGGAPITPTGLLDVAGEALGRVGERALRQDTLVRRAKVVVRSMVDSSRTEDREGPLTELHLLVERNKHIAEVVASEGGIPPMVEIASRGSMKAKEQAVAVLRRMAGLSAEHRAAIGRAGGVAPIVKVIVGGTTAATPQLRLEACAALAYLAKGQPANQSAIAEAGTLPVLIKLLSSQHDGERLSAAAAVCALTAGHEKNRAAVVAHGGVGALASMLMPHVFAATRIHPTSTTEQSLGALHSILLGERGGGQAHVDKETSSAAIKALRTIVETLPEQPTFRSEVIASLLGLVADSKGEVAECALVTLLVLLLETTPREIVEAGAVGLCVDKLGEETSGSTIVLAAGTTLRRLLLSAEGREAILLQVPQLVAHLGGGNATAVEHALALLDHLAAESDGRAAISEVSGAAPLVEIAVDAEGAAEPAARKAAMRILCDLATEPAALGGLLEAGAVPPLVTLLREGSAEDREEAATSLVQLTAARGGAAAAAHAGIVPPLVEQLLESGRDRSGTARAMQMVTNLAQHADAQSALVSSETVVKACVHTLQSASEFAVREQAAGVLLCLSQAGKQAAIIAGGGVGALVELLRSGGSAASLLISVRVLRLSFTAASPCRLTPSHRPCRPNPSTALADPFAATPSPDPFRAAPLLPPPLAPRRCAPSTASPTTPAATRASAPRSMPSSSSPRRSTRRHTRRRSRSCTSSASGATRTCSRHSRARTR